MRATIQLVLVKALLGADALGTLHPHLQLAQRRGSRRFELGLPAGGNSLALRVDLALHLARQHAQDRALALDGLPQALELLGVGIAVPCA